MKIRQDSTIWIIKNSLLLYNNFVKDILILSTFNQFKIKDHSNIENNNSNINNQTKIISTQKITNNQHSTYN